MLTLVLGRAGSGKTSYVMNDYKAKMDNDMTGLYYIVPEQYSHEAERQLLKTCGDTLSLHGEVLSFSRLCSRVFTETGGLSADMLDDGGKILLMSRAVTVVASNLRLYGKTEQKAEFLEKLVATAKEFKSACITPRSLEEAAGSAERPLNDKLYDLSLILGAYEALFDRETSDAGDRLNRLIDTIRDCTLFQSGHIYIDGFTDFTVQELRVIEELIKMDAELTVCLTCETLVEVEEIFETSRETALKLLRMASINGVASEIIRRAEICSDKAKDLAYLEKKLFLYNAARFDGAVAAVEIFKAAAPDIECEYAAAKVLELLRKGYRRRDIAVAVSDWQTYGTLAENIFEKYGLPVFVSKKTDINQKPPVALINSAFEIINNGWDYDSVFRYLKTGLTGTSSSDCDALENYVLKWNLRGTIWTREEDWILPPSGFGGDAAGDSVVLMHLNALRREIVHPILTLQRALRAADTFGGKLHSLYGFLEKIGLAQRIKEKADAFFTRGEIQLSNEYCQLWDILIRALDQFYKIAGGCSGSTAEFARLWKLLMTQYDLGTIPISLDRVTLGDIARIRRRGNRCLIVLGASDDLLPNTGGGDALLSDSERTELKGLGLPVSGTAEDRLYREMNLIYSAFSLPAEKLIVTYPRRGLSGGDKRPSFIIKRLKALFDIAEISDNDASFRQYAPRPGLELAASAKYHTESLSAAAAFEYFSAAPETSEKLCKISTSAYLKRGNLTDGKAAELYGHEVVMSASRVDKFYACRFLYFLQYGLGARPRKPAGFDAPTAGTFMHFILENVTRDITEGVGFQDAGDALCLELMGKYVSRYVEEALLQFKDKSSRFRYLFNRLVKDATIIVLDMVRELKNSDFKPLDFELDFSDDGDIPPHLVESGRQKLKIRGFVDRVDGWEHDGKLYLRVVDYKTGKKSFSLSDIWYGMNMQMLIYLFALLKNGNGRYEKDIVPAGVLYAPAREEILQVSRNTDDEVISELRAKKLRRSGLLLGDSAVIDAMEHGVNKEYLPVKLSKDGQMISESLTGPKRFGRLAEHIERMLLGIATSVQKGAIAAEPYFKNQADNACLFCDYKAACHFSEKDGDKRRFLSKIKTEDFWEMLEGGVEGERNDT